LLTLEQVARLDAIAEKLASPVGLKPNRSATLRRALERVLPELEREIGSAVPQTVAHG
jgi:hypothetical protein